MSTKKITSTATVRTEPTFPFIVTVEQQRLQLALILAALSPETGDVIIHGEKGTTRTTTVHALASFLSGSLANLPPSATEDRAVDSIDVETVPTIRHAQFNPGLFSVVGGGVLCIGEIDLLPDHPVDSVLDIATTGRVVVGRDGTSHFTISEFALVDTMNPERNELHPQLPDRLNLAIDATASRNPAIRAKTAIRRLDFDTDPESFVTRFTTGDTALYAHIDRVRTLLDDAELTPNVLGQITAVCATFDVDDMRTDIAIAHTVRAHAT